MVIGVENIIDLTNDLWYDDKFGFEAKILGDYVKILTTSLHLKNSIL